jgi:ABC-type enterochelin transport system substrate-binding protein
MFGTLIMRVMRMFTRSQAKTFKMKSVVVGMKYRKEADVKNFKLPVKAKLVREPRNKHDANAIMVVCNGRHIGYIPKCQTGKIHAKFKIISAVQVSANERSPGCPFVDITYKSL